MSQLRSILDQLAMIDPDDLSIEQVAEEIEESTRGVEALEVLTARLTKNLADRGGHVELGYPNPTAFLIQRGRMSAGHAKQVVTRANAAENAPTTFQARADGRLSTDQTRHLLALAQTVPDHFPDAEERLVEIVEGLSVNNTARALEYWRQSVDGPGEADIETQLARRGLSVSKTFAGMRRVDGWMTAKAGEAFETALNALMPPSSDNDTRSARQRRHDALEDLCRDWLDHGDTPTVGGEKPHMIVLSDLEALQGIAGGTHETLTGEVIDIDTLRQLACDCSVSRIVLGPDSEVLDVDQGMDRRPTPGDHRQGPALPGPGM